MAMADPSYPPICRQPNTDRPITDLQQGQDIPLIDLQQGLDPRRLGDACREWGVFRLVNHGIPKELSALLMEEAKRVLCMPFETKQAMAEKSVVYFWGTPVVTQPVKSLHWFDALQVLLGQQEAEGEVGSATCSSAFRSLVDEYGSHMARIARTVFDALAVDLKLESGLSTSYLCESDGIFRAYRYLCCPNTSNHIAFHAHTDSSTVSILNQDEVGGLQVLHDDVWLDVAPVPDTLIVNLGDMMQAISGDQYKSVEHRVLMRPIKERISLCYFSFPSDEGVIVNAKYKAFTYKDFRDKVKEDIEGSGYKVGLERFRINDLVC